MEESQSLTMLTINRAFVIFKLLDEVHVSFVYHTVTLYTVYLKFSVTDHRQKDKPS